MSNTIKSEVLVPPNSITKLTDADPGFDAHNQTSSKALAVVLWINDPGEAVATMLIPLPAMEDEKYSFVMSVTFNLQKLVREGLSGLHLEMYQLRTKSHRLLKKFQSYATQTPTEMGIKHQLYRRGRRSTS